MPHRLICGIFAVVVFIFCLLLPQAHATRFLDTLRPTPQTDALYITMLFHKMAGYQPDFDLWVKSSEEYQRTPSPQKTAYMNERLDVFYDYYTRVSPEDPIVVHIDMRLEPYDAEAGGFPVSGINQEVFFRYTHQGGHFAVIPTNIEEYKVYRMPLREMQRRAPGFNTERGGMVTLHFHMTPHSINTEHPALLSNIPHWMLAAEIHEVQLWSQGSRRPLWIWNKAESRYHEE
ncbi:MAG: hypothetical protein EA357_08745 [Micavibrio sp.]|nr:MAG: hypothetical protein EA357_08745 [Micavibrio sp.]